jgi:hypothetical protein
VRRTGYFLYKIQPQSAAGRPSSGQSK